MFTKNSIGTAMGEAKAAALKWLALVLVLLCYLGAIGYAEVRNYTLLARTLEASLLPLATVGIVCLGLLALGLPLLLHYGTEPGKHRLWVILLYAADLAIMGVNAVLDASLHTGATAPGWLSAWAVYVVPTVPILMMAGVAVLWLLDPAQHERDLTAQVRAATRAALAQRVVDAAAQADVNDAVEAAAQAFTAQIVTEALGQAMPRKALPAPVVAPANVVVHDDRGDDTGGKPRGGIPAAAASHNGHSAESVAVTRRSRRGSAGGAEADGSGPKS